MQKERSPRAQKLRGHQNYTTNVIFGLLQEKGWVGVPNSNFAPGTVFSLHDPEKRVHFFQ